MQLSKQPGAVNKSIGQRQFAFWLSMAILLMFTSSVYARDVSQLAGNLLLTPNHGQGEAWGKSKCSSCHFIKRLHNTVSNIKGIVAKKGLATCTGCHGSNGTTAPRQCLVCHNVNDMPSNPMRTGMHRHDFNLKKDLPTTSKQCLVCHVASDMDGKFEFGKDAIGQDLTMFDDKFVGKQAYVDLNDFCIRCHNRDHQQKNHPIRNPGRRDQSVAAEVDYLKTDKHGVTDGLGDGLYVGLREGYEYKSIIDCVDCHTMHGTTNPGLIIDNSLKGAFRLDSQLRNQAYKIEVCDDINVCGRRHSQLDKGDYSQLCVLCHSMQVSGKEKSLFGGDYDTGNGLSGVHFNDVDLDNDVNCVTCHNHGEAVQKGL